MNEVQTWEKDPSWQIKSNKSSDEEDAWPLKVLRFHMVGAGKSLEFRERLWCMFWGEEAMCYLPHLLKGWWTWKKRLCGDCAGQTRVDATGSWGRLSWGNPLKVGQKHELMKNCRLGKTNSFLENPRWVKSLTQSLETHWQTRHLSGEAAVSGIQKSILVFSVHSFHPRAITNNWSRTAFLLSSNFFIRVDKGSKRDFALTSFGVDVSKIRRL